MHADASGRVVKGAKYRWGWLSCSPGQHQQVLYFVELRWLFAECGGQDQARSERKGKRLTIVEQHRYGALTDACNNVCMC